MTKAPRFSCSIPLLKSLHWLPIKFIIQFKTFVFRCFNHGQPSYSSSLFSTDSVKHLRSNNTNKLTVPRIRAKLVARVFSVSGPTLCNLLPAHLSVAQYISSFRKLLKTHFFDQLISLDSCLEFYKDGLRLCAFIYSFIHLFIYSFIHLFIYSFIHLFIYSFIHLFIYSFIHLFSDSLIH